MNPEAYLHPLSHCTLCAHRCGVNRLAGQTGVCRMTLPGVASATQHPAPSASYTVFMAGCNYKCLSCQNWTLAQLPDNGYPPGRFVLDPGDPRNQCGGDRAALPLYCRYRRTIASVFSGLPAQLRFEHRGAEVAVNMDIFVYFAQRK